MGRQNAFFIKSCKTLPRCGIVKKNGRFPFAALFAGGAETDCRENFISSAIIGEIMQEKDNTTEKTQGAKAPEDKSGAFISENRDFVPESRVSVPETGGTSPKKPRLLVT